MKRLNMNLEDKLFWGFKKLCLQERISMTDKLTKYIRKVLDLADIKTDCDGICGFCEIVDSCDNPKRQIQRDKVKKRLEDSTDDSMVYHPNQTTSKE